ncbi:DNA-binding protein [Photobacterium ganghwense]|uniref:DNA-binding protein n=1 Tax=Photobacterium ganghwense TaxID=320778 RepID=A0A0J1HF12_9GAMM|nr:hypothetical protein [Photobacterium ganghwense]KLV10201.1 hypothetical protein ABT57_06390 [Photobacterium ganghwense]PSU05450.1 DNA-binding protein [Photobacterium ganghwense]
MVEKKRILTPSEWIELEVMWASGEYTLAALSEKSGMRPETLSRRFKARGVEKGSAATADAVREAVKEKMIDKSVERANLIASRQESYDKWAYNLGALVMKEVAEGARSHGGIGSAEESIKALQRASAALAKCYEVSHKALRMDDRDVRDDELPELMFAELTQEQVLELRKAQTGDAEDIVDLDELEAELAEEIASEREELEREEAESEAVT